MRGIIPFAGNDDGVSEGGFQPGGAELFSLLDQILEQGVREGDQSGKQSGISAFCDYRGCTSLVSRQCSECREGLGDRARLAYQMLVAAFSKKKKCGTISSFRIFLYK